MVANYKSPTFLTGSDKNEVYLDKDTGLCMKMVIDSETYEREYEFDNVSDDIFVEPDINQYTLQ